MFAICDTCGASMCRYGTDAEMGAPCEHCGGVLFWYQYPSPGYPWPLVWHEQLVNVATREKLSEYRESEHR